MDNTMSKCMPQNDIELDARDAGKRGVGGHEAAAEARDREDMKRMNRDQQLKRNFRTLTVFGLVSVVMGTWLGMITSSTFSLINGGRAGTIWVYLAVWFFMLFVTASMAEMASMAPSSGGQYHWVSEFAPPFAQKFLSYITGWLSALNWQAFIAVSAYQAGNLTLIAATVYNPGYTPTPWQGTLITIAVALFAVLLNIFGARLLPYFEGIVLIIHIFGFCGFMIVLLVRAPKASAKDVFSDFRNYGNWSSVGSACIVGQLAAAGAFIGVDSAAHMSEEVKDASRVVPRSMMLTVLVNGALGFAVLVTYVFCVQDIDQQIVQSTAAYPFIDVLLVATGSPIATICLVVAIIVLSIAMCMNATAAGSRQAWAFSSDHGLPFAGWFAKLTTINSTPVPVNAIFASLSQVAIIALLNLGGSQVFNSILGLVTSAGELTYAVSIGCVIWRRWNGSLPPARWSLGRYGMAINCIAEAYTVYSFVISFFPVFAQVTAKSMNWAVAMFGAVSILCSIDYVFRGRKKYEGPVARIKTV